MEHIIEQNDKEMPRKGGSVEDYETSAVMPVSLQVGANVIKGENGSHVVNEMAVAATYEGVWHSKAIAYLLLWYFWSGCTLFLNKYVVFYMKGDPTFLGNIDSLLFRYWIECVDK